MMRAWGKGLALLLCTAAAAGAHAESCQLHRIAEIPAHITPDNDLLVDATLDGTSASLLLDTGLGFSAINRRFADRLNLPIESLRAPVYDVPEWAWHRYFETAYDARDGGGAAAKLTQRTRVRRLELGGARSEDEIFAVLPLRGDGTDGGPVGIFGADYLAGYEVEIDPTDSKVRLFDQDHCPGRVVYWSQSYASLPISFDPATRLAMVDVELDGTKLRAAIDTGARWTTIPIAAAHRLFGLNPSDAALEQAPPETGLDGRAVEAYWARFAVLKIGGVLVRHPKIMVRGTNDGAPLPTGTHIPRDGAPDLLIGMNVLKTLRMMIAYHEGQLYYTAAAPGGS